MQEYVVGFVERESSIQGGFLFDQLLIDNTFGFSKYEKEFYLKFLVLDELKKIYYCFIPQNDFENYSKQPITKIDIFCKEIAGSRLLIQCGEEISQQKLDAFMRGEEMFSLFKPGVKGYEMFPIFNQGINLVHIQSYSINSTEKNKIGEEIYIKLLKLKSNIKFRKSPGNNNFIEGGYDVDAVFGGNPEAYWNLD